MQDLFVSNNSKISFLDKIKKSLGECKSFSFSVSFIKYAGLTLIMRELEEALERNVKGKIITTTYQNFTDIPTLNKLYELSKKYPNFECRLDYGCFGERGFHSKGYIFEYDGSNEIIVGSTNITRFALLKNIEWNISLFSHDQTKSYMASIKEFNELWDKTLPLNSELIKKYKIQLDYAIDKWDMDFFDPESSIIKPNAMQRKALKEIRRYRDLGVKRALVVSATGSGKTFLAAFDARNFDAKRLLFVVHRDAILSASMETFKKVFGVTKTYGLYTGKEQDLDCDFLFATNTMLSKHLENFEKNEFDYIVLDEAHHATAATYKKILEYFNAEFILGLTATPERLDNEDVFELFDSNVPYELRLHDAINNDLVVPFHYYGIRDTFADYSYEDKTKIAKEISSVENVVFIHSEIQKHLPQGKLKCIAFCTSISHAELMAEELNNIGYSAVALTGNDDLGVRLKVFNDLQDDECDLEIICAVDILNEGVDIPAVNMVLFLRPTESSTIFLQQLGRGLRKYPNKEYVTVLDFIGNNYDRSVQIAMALGSLSNNKIIEKSYIKALVNENFLSLDVKGVIIDIDKLAREEIIKYISNTNFNKRKILEKDYDNFKKYLNIDSYPKHMDYLNCDYAPDLLRFMKAKLSGGKNRSYYTFLTQIDPKNAPTLTVLQKSFIDALSELLPIVRIDEYAIIKQILNTNSIDVDELSKCHSKVNINTINHAIKVLKNKNILTEDCKLNIDIFSKEFEVFLKDLLEYGLTRFEIEFGEYDGNFKLYGNYYKSQIMDMLLESSQQFMKGTKFKSDGTTYLFVGLKKDKEKEEKTNYKDKFISPTIFQWESENNTTETNAIGKKILGTKKVHLFVRKMDEEDGVTLPFTYFGTGKFTNLRKSFVRRINDNKNTLMLDVVLDNRVSEEYHFDFEIPNKFEA